MHEDRTPLDDATLAYDDLVDAVRTMLVVEASREQLLAGAARYRLSHLSNAALADIIAEGAAREAYLATVADERAARRARVVHLPPVQPFTSDAGLAEWRDENAYLLNDPCVYCSAQAVSLDHITPRALGGRHAWENTAPACRSCNSSKGHWPLLVWLARRSMNAGGA